MSNAPAESMSLRRLLLIIGVMGLAFLFFGISKSCAARRQEEIVFSAVPGFLCPGLMVENSKQVMSWGGNSGYANSVLHMPHDCRARLVQQVASGLFVEGRCNSVERCWTRHWDGRRITLTFYPSYVALNVDDIGP